MAILTLSEVARYLRVSEGQHVQDLTLVRDAGEKAISRKCGPLEPTVIVERFPGSRRAFSLRRTPVISVTSIVPVGSTVEQSGYNVDLAAGVIEIQSGYFPASWYDVTYVAGRANLPDDLRLGILELIKHLWVNWQRGAAGRPSNVPPEPGAAYLWPYKVQQLIEPHRQDFP